jgi:hypothetical protein
MEDHHNLERGATPDSVKPPAPGTRRPWDRYDVIGAMIVGFLVALWVLHFVLPAPPPTDVL